MCNLHPTLTLLSKRKSYLVDITWLSYEPSSISIRKNSSPLMGVQILKLLLKRNMSICDPQRTGLKTAEGRGIVGMEGADELHVVA